MCSFHSRLYKAGWLSGGRKLYQSIRKDTYWSAVAVNGYATVWRCRAYEKHRIRIHENVQELQVFPATGQPKSVKISVLGELIKAARSNQYLLITINRITKLTRALSLKAVSPSEVGKTFLRNWLFNYGSLEELPAENGKIFTAKFFHDVCRILKIYNAFTTIYHPRTNGHIERRKGAVKGNINSYLVDMLADRDSYTPSSTYAYNCFSPTSTGLAPFELVLSEAPPLSALQTNSKKYPIPQEAKNEWKQCTAKLRHEAKPRPSRAKKQNKRNFDARLRKGREKSRRRWLRLLTRRETWRKQTRSLASRSGCWTLPSTWNKRENCRDETRRRSRRTRWPWLRYTCPIITDNWRGTARGPPRDHREINAKRVSNKQVA